MKILLIGATGQLGISIKKSLPLSLGSENIQLINPTKKDFDLLHPNKCALYIKEINPQWVINAAAYTDVDKAEIERKKALLINKDSPKAIAEALFETGGNLIQVSTDYVFDGAKKSPYLINDETNPINFYGKSKLDGEKEVFSILANTNQVFVLRTSWLISPNRNNFLLKILKLHNSQKEINVISDQIGSLTSTDSLANFCSLLIKYSNNHKNMIPNLLHWCDEGLVSWFDIAYQIGEIGKKLEIISCPAYVNPILTSQYDSLAERPKYSALDCQESEKLLKIKRPNWIYSIEEILKTISLSKKW